MMIELTKKIIETTFKFDVKLKHDRINVFEIINKSMGDIEQQLKNEYGNDIEEWSVSKAIWEKINTDEFWKIIDKTNMEDFFRRMTIKENYEKDIEIAIYMIMSYIYSEKYVFDVEMQKFCDMVTDNERDEGRWRIDTLNFYPISIDMSGIGEKATSWCADFQKKLFNIDNFDIFDVNKDSKTITRYGFVKSKELYNSLKASNIENRFLLDFSLGISLTNNIYKYTKEINNKKELDKLEEIISDISRLPCIYLRNEIAEVIFSFINLTNYNDNLVGDMKQILKKIVVPITEYYWFLLRYEWIKFLKDTKNIEDFLYEKEKMLTEWWNNYYNDDVPYKEVLKFKGKIPLYEKGEKLSIIEKFEEINAYYNRDKKEMNYFGVDENLKNLSEIRKSNNESFKEVIEIKDSTKKLDTMKVYALEHRSVMKGCLKYFVQDLKG
ncbi:MAG: hypothetical protein IJA10_08460 [Lachnospiraceae bacterium]|nr:hypothetical protein [Lachnospiraceae bacterium]